MGFFKDFKEDLSQAVDEVMPGEATEEKKENKEAKIMNDQRTMEEKRTPQAGARPQAAPTVQDKQPRAIPKAAPAAASAVHTAGTAAASAGAAASSAAQGMKRQEQQPVRKTESSHIQDMQLDIPGYDETTVITNGSKVVGSIESNGSVEIYGIVNGDIKCNGLLTIAGIQQGNVEAGEVNIEGARVAGEIKTEGSVKIGSNSVVVGDMRATSVYIAGAIKGDMDVNGSVILDTSAIVWGNIKCRVIQINEGAIIEGNCTQSYAEVDIHSIFGDDKK